MWPKNCELLWRIPWTEEPGGLQSIGLQSRTRLKWHSTAHLKLICCASTVPRFKKKKSQVPASLNHASCASHVQPGLRITRPQQQNSRNESKTCSCWVSLSGTCGTREPASELARFLWGSPPSASVKGQGAQPNRKGLLGRAPKFPYTRQREHRSSGESLLWGWRIPDSVTLEQKWSLLELRRGEEHIW